MTYVAKAAAVLVVTVARSEGDETRGGLEQPIDVAEAVVREVGGEAQRTGPDALVAQLRLDTDAARSALTALGESGNLNGSTHLPPSTS